MSGFGKLIQGAFVTPPSGATPLTLVAATASAATAMPSTKPDAQVSFCCSAAWWIDVGTQTGVAAPSSLDIFAANTLYSFACGPEYTHFRAISASGGSLAYWKSTRA
jgi:hypothetical protein